MLNQAEARECIFSRFEIWAGGLDEAGAPGAFHHRKNTHYRETRPRQFAPSTIRTSLLHSRCRFRKCANCSFSRIPLRDCSRPHGLLFGVEPKFRASLEDLDENLHSTLITKLRLKDAQPSLHWIGHSLQVVAWNGRALAEISSRPARLVDADWW